ncbi:unnamed protein product [Periconia digitata]|uniref:Uncharacterized protein n=1 Tax=Periconia digitata TaxID=1303443 RepID=A0A9W4XTN4_9PLEO|nr:unnamed protein product [Periconia digitata]
MLICSKDCLPVYPMTETGFRTHEGDIFTDSNWTSLVQLDCRLRFRLSSSKCQGSSYGCVWNLYQSNGRRRAAGQHASSYCDCLFKCLMGLFRPYVVPAY